MNSNVRYDSMTSSMRSDSSVSSVSEFELVDKKSPYLQYGVAMKAFLNLQVLLIKAFVVLSIFAGIQMIVFCTF